MLSAQLSGITPEATRPNQHDEEKKATDVTKNTSLDPNEALKALSVPKPDRAAGVHEQANEFRRAVIAAGIPVDLGQVELRSLYVVATEAQTTTTLPTGITTAVNAFIDGQELKNYWELRNGQPFAQPSAEARQMAERMSNASPQALALAGNLAIPVADAAMLEAQVAQAQQDAERALLRERQPRPIFASTTETIAATWASMREFTADSKQRHAALVA